MALKKRGRPKTPLDHISAVQRYTVLVKYARLERDGRSLMLCRPSHAELDDWRARKEGEGSDLKVIFNSKTKAEACITELMQFPNTRPMIAYPCGRSRTGHHHIATDKSALYGAPAAKIKDPGAADRRRERTERRRSAKRGESGP